MRYKHEDIFIRFSVKFTPEVIQKWTRMIELWDLDPQQPDPYAEPVIGESLLQLYETSLRLAIVSTMAQVRLELAEKEVQRLGQGLLPVHDTSPHVLLHQGLELEEQQYVGSCDISSGS
jgi:hypothetical protein